MKPSQRLFVPDRLGQGHEISLGASQTHYLVHVLRLPIGGEILLFNGLDGEWAAHLTQANKKAVTLVCESQSRPQDTVPDITLYFAPIKGDRLEAIIEKATELGAARIVPVITDRTIVRKVNLERLLARAVEAAEQTGRLSVPRIDTPVALDRLYDAQFLNSGAQETASVILFADEGGDARPIAQVLAGDHQDPLHHRVGLLTGPEGGFTPEERSKLRACAHIQPVNLGPRILRADTATFAGLSLIQATWGDWSRG
jgi:16S rRNA (uracil1498-N3)-methyltransferase